jgi:photosystem II stability/assembly factor-like uncharacterized protein
MIMKKQHLILASMFSLMVSAAPNANAQWVDPNGPFGTTLTSLAVSGSNLFAGTTVGGVYLSTDNGTSWTAINSGLTTNYVTALATAGTDVFAGTYENGVFVSTDNGTSWSAANSGLLSKQIQVLTASGGNLFAGTGGSGGGVYLSTNNGNSWNSASAGLTDPSVTAIAASGTYLFAGTANGLVFFSTNNGTFWTSVSTGLPTGSVTSLEVLGTNNPPTNLVAGLFNAIYTTTNMGTSWTASTTGLPSSIGGTSFAIIGTNIFAGTYDGVFLSSNSGTSWNVVDTGLPPNPNIAAMASIGSNVFAGTSNLGVFRSTNNGANWTSPNTGLPVNSVNVLYENGSDLYAGTLGVYRSTDNGSDWTPASNGLPEYNMDVTALISVGTYLFAGTQSAGSGIDGDNVFLSTDSGASWNPASAGIPFNSNVTAFAVMGDNLFAATEGGIFRSTNSGTSWTGVYNNLPSNASVNITTVPINALAVIGTKIFAGTTSESNGNQSVGGGVYMSTDSGGSWTDVSSGLPTMIGPNDVNALAVIGTMLFAGTSSSQPQYSTGPVFISTNNGTTWTDASAGFPTNAYDGSLLADGKNLYAGATLGGILVSTDNGTSWTDAGSPPLAGIHLAVNPAYLFTAYQSVWRLFLVNLNLRIEAARDTQSVSLKSTGSVSVTLSDDTAGAVAHRINFVNTSNDTLVVDSAALTNLNAQFSISQLIPGIPDTVYPNDTFSMIVVFGGDDTGGIYRDTVVLSVGDPTSFYVYLTGKSFSSPSGVLQNLPIASTDLRSYPNPFSQQSTIEFSSAEQGYAEVTVINLLGSQVSQIFSGELAAGKHEFSWNASGMTPGMYECIAQVNGQVQRIPMILSR